MHLFLISALQHKFIWIYQKNRGEKYAGSMNHLEGINILFKKYIWFSDNRNVHEKDLLVWVRQHQLHQSPEARK